MERTFDVIVLGAGPAGEIAAGRLAERGMSVAIAERRLVGGECSFYACMPSKALLRPADALHEAKRVPGVAEAASGTLDVDAVLARRDEVINHLDDSHQLPWLQERGIELFRGTARLDGELRVRVGEHRLAARHAVVIAPGSDPSMPPIPGLAEAAAWTNRELVTARTVPDSLLVLGGGPVGVELAQAWASLGSRVTLVEAGERLLAREEPFASDLLREALVNSGIAVHTSAKASSVRRERQRIVVTLDSHAEHECQRLLVAVGRQPATGELGLETVGLEPGKSIEVDDQLRAARNPWLYAIGDVNSRALLTHAGKYQARIAADCILGENATVRIDGAQVPRVTFTDPQVAATGLTLDQAHAREIDAEAIDLPTGASAGASFHGRGAPGTSRFVVDTARGVLVGATFVGADIAELLHAATIAIVGEVPLRTLAHAIAAFPTRSELWLAFLEERERRASATLHA